MYKCDKGVNTRNLVARASQVCFSQLFILSACRKFSSIWSLIFTLVITPFFRVVSTFYRVSGGVCPWL